MSEANSTNLKIEESSLSDRKLDSLVGSRMLLVARYGWYLALGPAVVVFLLSLPGYMQGLQEYGFTPGTITEPTLTDQLLNFAGMAASLIAVLVSLGLSAVLYWRKPDDLMALYLSYFLLAYAIILAGPLEIIEAYELATPGVAARYAQPIMVAAPNIVLFCIFPNGKFQPGWTRGLAVVSFLLIPLLVTAPFYRNPSEADLLDWGGVLIWISVVLAALYAQIYRFRHLSTPEERQQTKWAVFGFVLWVITVFILTVPYLALLSLPAQTQVPGWAAPTTLLWWFSLLIIPVTLTIAVMRFRLWDLGSVVNRTLVYGGLTAIVITIYIFVVGALSVLFQTQGNLMVSLIATGLVAVLFQPLRDRLQSGANRLIYGERDDPVTVLSRLGKQLELAIPQHSVLPELVETIAETLKLPYVGISLETNGELVTAAEYGRRSQSQVALPLVFQGEDIGKLTVAQRSSGEPFNPSEMALLENISRQAGAAAHSVQLTADLRRSRQRLVTAREEERRRLRRDLHDGLGPALAAHQLKIGSARALLDRDPEKVQQILDGLEHDVGETLSQIRHLVYGLRPPELDQLGLLAAVEQSINRHRTASEHTKQEGKVRIDVTLPVLQHAKASQCQINFRLENGFLYVEIADNGVGLSKDRPAGVGLTSMRERTEELGGVIDISGKIGRGTQVMARLPVPHWEQDGLER